MYLFCNFLLIFDTICVIVFDTKRVIMKRKGVGFMADFGNNLKRLRNSKGLTQDELAEAISMNRSTLGNWERGIREPKSLSDIQKLAVFFNCSPNDLIGDDSENLKELVQDVDKLDVSLIKEMRKLNSSEIEVVRGLVKSLLANRIDTASADS